MLGGFEKCAQHPGAITWGSAPGIVVPICKYRWIEPLLLRLFQGLARRRQKGVPIGTAYKNPRPQLICQLLSSGRVAVRGNVH